jgi:CubicO group peptidase (beta-lactamase class C family)
MTPSDPIEQAMQSAVETGVFPGAVLCVRSGGRPLYHRAFGSSAIIPRREPVRLDTLYDLASLTKPLTTATATLSLLQEKRLGLDDPLEGVLPELQGSAVGRATLFHLLNHSSGLPGWRPLYERLADQNRMQPGFLGSEAAKATALRLIRDEALLFPVGSRSLYSDLGFMLLGFAVERAAGCSLAVYCGERIYDPIGAGPLFFIGRHGTPVGGSQGRPVDLTRVAPTEDDEWRGRLLRAEVHDENAYALGGIAGHAGLFGTAGAVLTLSGCWLDGYLGRGSVLRPEWVRRFASRQVQTAGSSWGLGWDTPSAPSSSGTKLSAESFGHLGFTGTSLWIDPAAGLEVVLLTNRVHPTRKNDKIREFRPLIHDLIYEQFVESTGS